ncbi:hypothetical protein H2200_008872 [Cladophialophora chaetospira]|uniref:Aminoglycoside phosphotransferase domain-containing protein n=1 Tax=Cladophialophora chaetospira TaxID=386627 RepID=A0AA39CG48_9EURO|nr:hypothetical protein H2200_008872 [Cladophialophora chaetospira]
MAFTEANVAPSTRLLDRATDSLEDRNDANNDGDVNLGSTEDSDPESDEDEFDWRKRFQNVMNAIDLEALKNNAVELRLSQSKPELVAEPNLSCQVLEEPMHGSYNLVYVLEFNDSVKWVARIPIQGTRVEEADIDRMTTDYSTLRFIRRSLGAPVPETYAFETNCDRIGVPFALMSFIDGVSVADRWFDKEWITEEKRLKILTNLVHAMAKLQQPRFGKVGTLRFSDENTVSHLGPLHTVIEEEDEYVEEGIIHVAQCGPFNSVDGWLEHNWDTFQDVPQTALWGRGCLELMKLARLSIPAYLRRSNRFEIDVWDYNSQNILIDDDCNITGILDWDGIRVVPQGMGCTRFPSWITRDWDLGTYETAEDGDWEAIGEDSPETLSRYRKHYADTFASLDLPNYDPRETRLSHILEAIKLGTQDRFCRQYIMRTLLNHAYGSEQWPWDYPKIAKTLMNPSTRAAKAMRKQLLKQFETMWHAEWETPELEQDKRASRGPRRYLPRRRPAKQTNTAEKSTKEPKEDRPPSRGRAISEYVFSKLGLSKR